MQLVHVVVACASLGLLLSTEAVEVNRNFDLLGIARDGIAKVEREAGLIMSEPALERASPYHSVEAKEQHFYQLRMCNAYADSQPLEMRRVQAPQLIEYPLPYKACHDYTLPLKAGDELRFQAGEEVVGTFIVRGLPKPGALLLIVPHRRESTSSALAFDSHVFAQGDVSQVAIIDAFSRSETKASASLKDTSKAPAAFVRLTDAGASDNITTSLRQTESKQKPRKQDLRFNSVVELKPGSYQMALGSSTKASSQALQVKLNAVENEAYVAIRVGFDDGKSKQYPEELLVYPRSAHLMEAENSAACLPRAQSWGAFIFSSAVVFFSIMQ